MVGGLADWFAVTALFRHPLGLPIPHTAIVVERKDQFAATLGAFIQESFLTPDAIAERVAAARVGERAATWLAVPANAERVAAEVTEALVAASALLRDEDVHRTLAGMVRERADAVVLAPLAGRALAVLLAEGRHEQVLDAGLSGLNRYVEEHQVELRLQLAGQSRGWLRDAVDQRVFERVIRGLRETLEEMQRDRRHPLRVALTARLQQLAHELTVSQRLRDRGEELKAALLDRPEVAQWVAGLWSDLKAQLASDAQDPGSRLRRRAAGLVAALGAQIGQDPALATKLEQGIDTAVRHAVARSGGAIAGVVSTTIARWDAEETASRLELLLGPDLQWVRINGTVVGAAAGLLLHLVGDLLG